MICLRRSSLLQLFEGFFCCSFVILCREKRWTEMKLSLTDQLTTLRLQTHPAPLWKKFVDSKYSWMKICSWSTISCVLLECRLNLCSWDALDTNSNMSCSWVLDILIPDHLKYRFVFLFSGRNSDARKMGRSWFSAIKRVFIPSSKDKPVNVSGILLCGCCLQFQF